MVGLPESSYSSSLVNSYAFKSPATAERLGLQWLYLWLAWWGCVVGAGHWVSGDCMSSAVRLIIRLPGTLLTERTRDTKDQKPRRTSHTRTV